MTEEEAKAKWCPFVRCGNVSRDSDNVINRFVHNDGHFEGLRCIGSQCMTWRWEALPSAGQFGQTVHHGYCGLAGRP